MIVFDSIVFAIIAVIIFAVFMNEYSKEAARKAAERSKLRGDIELAVSNRDLGEIKRIRLLNEAELNKVDEGLSKRLDAFADELYIEQDERNTGAKNVRT